MTETTYDSTPDTLDHIHRVQVLLDDVIERLEGRAASHDDSKLEPPEKEIFDVYTPKLAELEYGTDEYREALAGMKPALDHHYANNSHHPEHYERGINGMSLLDLIEMFCDWKAAGERHNSGGNILHSLQHNRERFGISEQLVSIFENTALELGYIELAH